MVTRDTKNYHGKYNGIYPTTFFRKTKNNFMLFSHLLLENACSNENFTEAEILLIENAEIPAFATSWIIFRASGLLDPSIREELRRGLQPWNAHLAENFWIFNPNHTPLHSLTIEEAKVEWRAYMSYWSSITIHNNRIEIFNLNNTANNQLGVRLNSRTSAGNMIDQFRGFLHPIDEICYNQQLQSLGYKHIYRTTINDNIIYYLIFGPVTLARKDMQANLTLETSPTTALMIFQLGCGQVYHDEESWEDGYRYYDGYSLKIEEAEMFNEEQVINFLERNVLELTKTTVLLITYIHVNDVDTYYNVGVEIAIKD